MALKAAFSKNAVRAAAPARKAVVVQARRTTKPAAKSSTPDSIWYGPERPLFLGAFTGEYWLLRHCISLHIIVFGLLLHCEYVSEPWC